MRTVPGRTATLETEIARVNRIGEIGRAGAVGAGGVVERREIPVALKDILRGRGEDVVLEMDDILWVPDSRAKSVLNRGVEAAIQMATGIVVWRR